MDEKVNSGGVKKKTALISKEVLFNINNLNFAIEFCFILVNKV